MRQRRADALVAQQRLQRVGVDPVALQLDHAHVGAAAAQVQQRAVIGRLLHDDRVAGLDQRLEEERVGLHRAVGDDDLRGVDAVLVGDPLAQRAVADGGAVGRGAGRIALEGAHGGGLEALHVDDVERRGAAGEGDHVRHRVGC